MACFQPLHVFRMLDGRLAGTAPAGQVPRPVTIPCGQCRGCRLERARQWAVRCVHEAQCHDANSFITLTYDDEHLPKDLSLDLVHWQLFAKKLRNHFTKLYRAKCEELGVKPDPKFKPFRFYHCGEYGEGKGKRPINPHYHALIFGQDFSGDRKFKKFTPQGHQTYSSETLTRIWGKGLCEIGSVTTQSAGYVARYCMKKQGGDQAEAHYEGRKPEYATMSRRPGIGEPWFQRFHKDVYPHDYVMDSEGHKSRPPKYYDKLVDLTNPDLLVRIKELRVSNARKHRANNTPKRLKVRETVLNAKLTQLKRSL